MNNLNFLFTTETLENSKISDSGYADFKHFITQLTDKIGTVIKMNIRLCRVSASEPNRDYQKFCVLAVVGQNEDALIEITPNENIESTKWPTLDDIQRGKRLMIEVVDWVDLFLIIRMIHQLCPLNITGKE